MSNPTMKLLTAEQYGALPERTDGMVDELIDGVVVVMEPLNKPIHGFVCSRVGRLLSKYAQESELGWVTMRAGYILWRNPDTVRAPDLAFYSFARLPVVPEGYAETSPDLIVEVLAPENTYDYIIDKTSDYLTNGVRMVWIVDPADRTVAVYDDSQRMDYSHADTLDGGDVLPGFTCKVADFFS